ncbi:MAG: MerR family transcriptional regulator [Desulfobacterales bacterium]|nr:MerR family transcriptional regulator [Desulfobacterales bacterium]
MKISELVKRTNVSKETIHYYIREGALPKPRKSGKNTADYDEETIEQIQLIKNLQENFFLPLSEIKKILKQQKKHSLSDKIKFKFLTKNVRPVDQISFNTITGGDSFIKATGISEKWLDKMEEWGVITPESQDDCLIYSSDNVTIGKLIVNMGHLGFGPKDGYNPEKSETLCRLCKECRSSEPHGFSEGSFRFVNVFGISRKRNKISRSNWALLLPYISEGGERGDYSHR